jgi:hypothetical protein
LVKPKSVALTFKRSISGASFGNLTMLGFSFMRSPRVICC